MNKAVVRFIITGLFTVAVDFFTYRLLLSVGLSTEYSKVAGFITGSLFAYWVNKQWTFEAGHQSHTAIVPFAVLYSTTLLVNVALNEWVLRLLSQNAFSLLTAFLVATLASATLNFLGLRAIVFSP